jgi:hypothetical protein
MKNQTKIFAYHILLLRRDESMMEKTLASIERVKKKEAKQRKQDDEVLDC